MCELLTIKCSSGLHISYIKCARTYIHKHHQSIVYVGDGKRAPPPRTYCWTTARNYPQRKRILVNSQYHTGQLSRAAGAPDPDATPHTAHCRWAWSGRSALGRHDAWLPGHLRPQQIRLLMDYPGFFLLSSFSSYTVQVSFYLFQTFHPVQVMPI